MEPPNKVFKLCDSPILLPTSDEVITEKDLPLLANIEDVRVHHYLMKLRTNFSSRVISGSVILFLEWLKPGQNKLILDQCFLKIKQVVLLKTEEEYDVVNGLLDFDNCSGSRKYFYRGEKQDWFTGESFEHLAFMQSKWSVAIQGWKEDNPPSVIKIEYETLETSPSLHWRSCDGFKYQQASSKCCYTPAPAVNNRGLFPCQEPPSAMATWEVMVECEKEYTPLLTSDEPGQIIGDGEEDSIVVHYFYCSIPLPMSTFAMCVGKPYFLTDLVVSGQKVSESESKSNKLLLAPRDQADAASSMQSPLNICQNHGLYPCRFGACHQQQERLISVRLFCFDPNTVPRDCRKFKNLVTTSLTASSEHFGPHPFSRLDIVVVPKSYPHEGLSSPSMIFLSPNNFYGEEPLYVWKLPHEICHGWFGLLIGSLDWTEEWLSEGFATFCEDVLFPVASENFFPEKSAQDIRRDHALKILMRFTSLQTELRNTNENHELHVIAKGNSNSSSVTNGLVPIKQFMHVHYYKGYLLLWHLASLVGQNEFLKFLKEYVLRYHGQLVTSEIFLECYHSYFKEILGYQDCNDIITNLKKEWLQSNKLPEPYNSLNILEDNFSEGSSPVPLLFSNAVEPLKNVKRIFEHLLQEDQVEMNFKLESLSSSELLLLMELILSGLPKLAQKKWNTVEKKYFKYFVTSEVFRNVEQRHNAEVAHRWCELIIFFKDKSRLPVVENFLKNNISMGVYLYGELMITERFAFQKVAKQVYYDLKDVYDLATNKILKEMIL